MSPLTTFLSRLIGLLSILICVSMVTHRRATVETVTALVHNPPLLLLNTRTARNRDAMDHLVTFLV